MSDARLPDGIAEGRRESTSKTGGRLDWAASIVLLLGVAGWSLLSLQFVYGQDHGQRPILSFLALYGLVWLAYLRSLGRLSVASRRPSLGWVIAVSVLARLILLPSLPIQEDDFHRYVLDGQVVVAGEDPYRHSPSDLAHEPFHPLAGELSQGLGAQTVSRVSHPEIRSIYPPAAQGTFALGVLWGGWDWQGQRWALLVVDGILIGLLLILLRLLKRPLCWVLAYSWNPLALKEVANSAHVDVLAALFLTASMTVLALGPGRNLVRKIIRSIGTGTLAGMAVLSKLYPLLLVPTLGLHLVRPRRNRLHRAVFFSTVGLVCWTGYRLLSDLPWRTLFEGLAVYGRTWRINEGAFALIDSAIPWAREVSLLPALSLAVLFSVRGSRDTTDLIDHLRWILLAWLLFLPALYPWYALPLVALIVVDPRAASARIAAFLSGATGIYYFYFYCEYQSFPEAWWMMARVLEHASIWLALLIYALWKPVLPTQKSGLVR